MKKNQFYDVCAALSVFFFVVVVGTDQLQLFAIWIQGVTNSEHRISHLGLPSGSRVCSNKIAKLEGGPGGGPREVGLLGKIILGGKAILNRVYP